MQNNICDPMPNAEPGPPASRRAKGGSANLKSRMGAPAVLSWLLGGQVAQWVILQGGRARVGEKVRFQESWLQKVYPSSLPLVFTPRR